MSRLSLRWRVVLCVALVELAVLLVSAIVMFGNARTAIGVEVTASRELARNYVLATVGSLLRGNAPETVMEFLPGHIDQPRHVRIIVIDRITGLVHQPAAPAPAPPDDDGAPGWFHALLSPGVEELSLPVTVGQKTYGEVIIATEPLDEIDEVWEDLSAQMLIWGVSYVVLLLAVSVAITRSLRPLDRMTLAFGRLEGGDYDTRIGPVEAPELSRLADRFNALAAALSRSIAEKDALNRKLITVQDRERKAIALELHDEFGPCLFGVRVEARSILETAQRIEGPEGAVFADRARSILGIAEQIQTANRNLLQRLRPMEIGQLPLAQVLDDLAGRMADRGGDIDWQVEIDQGLGTHDETSELAIYRIVQEGLTNVLRHAGARTVALSVRGQPDRAGRVVIRIEDDGCGPGGAGADGRGPGWTREDGVGLRGMRERAESLGGRFSLRARTGGGTILVAEIPVTGAGSLAEAS